MPVVRGDWIKYFEPVSEERWLSMYWKEKPTPQERTMKYIYEVTVKHADGSWGGRRFAAESIDDALKQHEKAAEHPVSSLTNQYLSELKVCRVQL